MQLGVAVENARLFSDVRRRLSDLEAVHALALRIFENAPGDVRAVLEDGCREVARALSARAAAVLLADGDGRTLRGVAAYGAPMDPTELRISLEEDGLAAEAFRRRAPAWSPDVKADSRSSLGAAPGMPPLAILAVPLTSRVATRGVLFVADDPGRTFGDPELALANALAGELAVGLENAELYAEARAQGRGAVAPQRDGADGGGVPRPRPGAAGRRRGGPKAARRAPRGGAAVRSGRERAAARGRNGARGPTSSPRRVAPSWRPESRSASSASAARSWSTTSPPIPT